MVKMLDKCLISARLAQSVERETFNLKAKGSSPLSGELFFFYFFSSFNMVKLYDVLYSINFIIDHFLIFFNFRFQVRRVLEENQKKI